MKGSNSRMNFDAKARYSNVFHIQGGMITDSDLVEASEIGLERDEAQSRAMVASGVPSTGGMITVSEGDVPFLQEGTVFAEGKQGHFRLTTPTVDDTNPLEAYGIQADYPNAPALDDTPALLYADLWQRPVFALQDSDLTDAGLHGTETSYRALTMVQIKTLPLEGFDPDTVEKTIRESGAFLKHGTAKVKMTPRAADVEVDNCDPCAEEVEEEETLPNALWRLEIVGVERANDNSPKTLHLAWSMENASVVEVNKDVEREALTRDNSAYQFFSDLTEMNQGWFASDVTPAMSEFHDTLAGVPKAGDPNGFDFVRRWDGHAVVDVAGLEVKETISVEKPKITGKRLVITAKFFSIEIPLENEDFLIGDHWLVEIRRFADTPDRLKLVGAQTDGLAPPHGIVHHHCQLMFIENQKPTDKQPNDLTRATSFPPLTDIPSTHVSYDPPEKCPVYGDAQTVKQALDKICKLDAKHVHFDSNSGCETLGDATNVHDALEALCRADDDKTLRLVLRTMMDWGVVCGVRLSLDGNNAEIVNATGGTVLDRIGNIEEFKSAEINLNKIEEDAIHGDLGRIQEIHGEVCLSVELHEDKPARFHLSDPDFPYVTSDMTLQERLNACLEGRETIDQSKLLSDLNDEARIILNKIMTAWTNRDSLGSVIELNEEELQQAEEILDALSQEFASFTSDTYVERLKQLYKRADEEIGSQIGRSGKADNVRRLQLMVAKFGLLARIETESRNDCFCSTALPDCPVHDEKKPVLVPIGCVTLNSFKVGNLTARAVCDLCCRKQAHTWNSYRYYFGDQLQAAMAENKERCCGGEFDNGSIEDLLDKWDPTPNDLLPNLGSEFWPPDPGVTNLAPRSGPDVRGLNLDSALSVLKSAGVSVVHDLEVRIEDGEVFGQIAKALGRSEFHPLNLDYQARPGDTVALVTSKSRVIDMFVTKHAPFPGVFDFSDFVLPGAVVADGGLIPNDGVTDPPRITDFGTLTILEGQIKELEDRNKALEETNKLTREQLQLLGSNITRVEAEFKNAPPDLPFDADAIGKMEGQIKELETRNKELEEISQNATKEVSNLRAEMGKMESTMMGFAPIGEMVTPREAELLKASGITTIREFDNANTTTLNRALGNNARTLSAVRTKRNNFRLN